MSIKSMQGAGTAQCLAGSLYVALRGLARLRGVAVRCATVAHWTCGYTKQSLTNSSGVSALRTRYALRRQAVKFCCAVSSGRRCVMVTQFGKTKVTVSAHRLSHARRNDCGLIVREWLRKSGPAC
jgi:hypothetical protein